MAQSIKFDNVEILDTTHVPRFVKHESIPERILNLLDLPRDGGSVVISDKYGTKRITLTGYLVGSSKSDLETKIDVFKELFSRKQKILSIDWEGGSRTYVATCVRHDFDRDHFNIGFVPWTAEFTVPKGIGEDGSETPIIINYNWNAISDYNVSPTFAGSAPPKPRITLTFQATLVDTCGVSIKNNTTGEEIIITWPPGWVNGDILEIDCRNKTVKYAGYTAAFYKMFPSFQIGVNSLTFKTCDIIDQQSYEFGTGINNKVYGGGHLVAQSFMVPYTDSTYRRLWLRVMKLGVLAKDLLATIQTDNAGKPSGVVVTNANFAFPDLVVGASYAWYDSTSAANFTLNANTRYWIVLDVEDGSGDSSNCYQWLSVSGIGAVYKKGNKATTVDGGTNWTDVPSEDATFRLCYGGYGGQNAWVNVYYYKQYL
jgi:hypothetical protein